LRHLRAASGRAANEALKFVLEIFSEAVDALRDADKITHLLAGETR
jgi:hypothetical protein